MTPVSGPVVLGFGDQDPLGIRDHGLVIEARPNAIVVAPYDGEILHVGPFDGLGTILIIEHGEGYHTLLAGFERVILDAGRRVLAGEPVGVMGPPVSSVPRSQCISNCAIMADPIDPYLGLRD